MYLRRIWMVRAVFGGQRVTRHNIEFACKYRGMRYRILGEDAQVDEDTSSSWDVGLKDDERGESVHLGKLMKEKIEKGETFCSYELFPTEKLSIYQRFFKETQKCSPIFYALTWHEESTKSIDRFPSLKVIEHFPRNTLLHVTAKGLTCAEVKIILNRALELGIINVFALKGDAGSEDGDFKHASDLVTFIRKHYGQKFCICVAGYPEMHPKSSSKEQDILYLKAKIDAGADFVITQFFFESHLYIKFVKDCRNIGINVPIIPGIYPFISAKLLYRMTNVCQAAIPSAMKQRLEELGENDEAVKEFGIKLSAQLITDIRKSGLFNGYHLYTLNRPFSATEIYRLVDNTSKNWYK